MSGFHVEPEDLKSYSRMIGRASDDTTEAISYINKWCSMSSFEAGPISTLSSIASNGHKDVVGDVSDALNHLRKVLDASKKELEQASRYYRQTDFEEAKKLGDLYPRVKR